MAEFLTRHNLSTYADAFDAHGWDDISQLSSTPESDLAKLVADVKMKSGHVARLRAALGKPAPTPPAPPAAPTQSQPHSSPHILKGSKLGSIRRRVQAKAATTRSTVAYRLCFHPVCVPVCT